MNINPNKFKLSFLLAALILIPVTIQAKEKWLFIGDSITQQGHYVDYVEAWYLWNNPEAPEIINLGLNSETCSGLSEPDHDDPRPCILNRLDRVLERVKPDVVFACYGMNCGIYHPLSDDRFNAYKNGIRTIIDRVKQSEAKLILLTPPPYADRVISKKSPESGEHYSYKTPYSGYNEVLQTYATWMLTLGNKEDVKVVNIRSGIEKFMENCYPKEPVHPNAYGHKLMAESLLKALGKTTNSKLLITGEDSLSSNKKWIALLTLIKQQRETYDRPLMNDIGHENHQVAKRIKLSLSEGEEQVKIINTKIEDLLGHSLKK